MGLLMYFIWFLSNILPCVALIKRALPILTWPIRNNLIGPTIFCQSFSVDVVKDPYGLLVAAQCVAARGF